MRTTAVLATRSVQGAWSVEPGVAAASSALAIDAEGNAHLVSARATGTAERAALHDVTAGIDRPLLEVGTPVRLRTTTIGKSGQPHDAVVALTLAPGSTELQVLIPSTAGYQSIALPELTPAMGTRCPDGRWFSPAAVPALGCGPAGACTLTGDLNGSFALGTTADGTAWLAVIVRHVDEDVSYTANGPMCKPHIDKDRSTQDLALWRVVLGSPPRLVAAPRMPLGNPGYLDLAVAAAGSRLSFAVISTTGAPSTARYLVVDTSLLP
jgi:hypothetical protein